jgi:hypothetical protein
VAEPDANRSGRGFIVGPDIFFRLAECRKHGAGMLVEPPARRGQRDAARPSIQQPDAQLGFEGGNMVAQRGLRKLVPQEWLRFGWFFLVTRRDPAGLAEWIRLRRLGRSEKFGRDGK